MQAAWCTQSELGHKNRRNHLGRLRTSFKSVSLLVHVYFVARTVCKSRTQCTVVILSPLFDQVLTHKFKPAECNTLQGQQNSFHGVKTGMSGEGHCRCNTSPLHVPATCPLSWQFWTSWLLLYHLLQNSENFGWDENGKTYSVSRNGIFPQKKGFLER